MSHCCYGRHDGTRFVCKIILSTKDLVIRVWDDYNNIIIANGLLRSVGRKPDALVIHRVRITNGHSAKNFCSVKRWSIDAVTGSDLAPSDDFKSPTNVYHPKSPQRNGLHRHFCRLYQNQSVITVRLRFLTRMEHTRLGWTV